MSRAIIPWALQAYTIFCSFLMGSTAMGAFSEVDLGRDRLGSNVWIYSLVGTDYDGHKMLPHFLAHYTELGIPTSNFHIDLLHDPAEPDAGLQAAISVASQQKISFSVIAQPYLPALQDIEMMKSLDRMNIPPLDWIIVADVDELYTYGSSAIGAAIAEMEAEGATFALAEMLDHVSSSGNITALTLEPKIWQQYPMICPVTAKIGLGLPAKVAIHRGFLRAGAGHHHIVEPEFAKSYFGKHCMPPECETMMEKYKQRSTLDVYRRTPYYKYRYIYRGGHHRARIMYSTEDKIEWTAKQWTKWAKVHHFKWHAGIITNLQQRSKRDSGNCILGVNEAQCTPKFQFWQEVARQYAAVAQRQFNVSRLGCKKDLDTFWNWNVETS